MIGTLLAAIGWAGDLLPFRLPLLLQVLKFDNMAIFGHVLQIIGAFGMLLIPEQVVEKDFEV
ncbi:MAG: hypothetical protein WCH46_01800 [bacterium]